MENTEGYQMNPGQTRASAPLPGRKLSHLFAARFIFRHLSIFSPYISIQLCVIVFCPTIGNIKYGIIDLPPAGPGDDDGSSL